MNTPLSFHFYLLGEYLNPSLFDFQTVISNLKSRSHLKGPTAINPKAITLLPNGEILVLHHVNKLIRGTEALFLDPQTTNVIQERRITRICQRVRIAVGRSIRKRSDALTIPAPVMITSLPKVQNLSRTVHRSDKPPRKSHHFTNPEAGKERTLLHITLPHGSGAIRSMVILHTSRTFVITIKPCGPMNTRCRMWNFTFR